MSKESMIHSIFKFIQTRLTFCKKELYNKREYLLIYYVREPVRIVTYLSSVCYMSG